MLGNETVRVQLQDSIQTWKIHVSSRLLKQKPAQCNPFRGGGNVFSNIYVNKCNGHIATAFLMISEVPAREGSEFIITVQKDTRNNTDAEAYCNVIE